MQNKVVFRNERIRTLTALSVFCAISYLCVFVFRIHVTFLTFDIKDAVIAIAGMVYGPVSAVAVSAVTSLLEFVTISDTGVYGLIMNILSSVSFSLTAALIYKYRRTFSGAIVALLSAILVMTAVMMGANLIVTPYFMGVEVAQVRAMLPTLFFPFNATKAALNAGVVLLLYKRLSLLLRPSSRAASGTAPSKTLPATLIAVALIAAALTVFFFVLGGNISFFSVR